MAYTLTEKMNILSWARDHGTIDAARKFCVQPCTIIRWNKQYKVYQFQKIRTFSPEKKKEILEYANKFSLTHACKKYDVDYYTLQQWNRKMKIYVQQGRRNNLEPHEKQPRKTDEFKIMVLKCAKQHGTTYASKKYGVAASTVRMWNDKFHIYTPRTNRFFTPQNKQSIIEYAMQSGIAEAARKFNVTGWQIQTWIDKSQQNQK